MNQALDLNSEYIANFRQVDEHLFAGAQPVILVCDFSSPKRSSDAQMIKYDYRKAQEQQV